MFFAISVFLSATCRCIRVSVLQHIILQQSSKTDFVLFFKAETIKDMAPAPGQYYKSAEWGTGYKRPDNAKTVFISQVSFLN